MRGKWLRWPARAIGISLLSGCVSDSGTLELRAVELPSSKISGGPSALSEAQRLLNLGNPGLALEVFRKVQRDQPSADALAGIAACYVSMGRDDLAKANLEAALALQPRSAQLLAAIALVMDRLGLKEEAAIAQSQARELSNVELAQPVQAAAPAPDSAEEGRSPPPPQLALEIATDSQPLLPSPPLQLSDREEIQRAVEAARRLVAEQDLSSSVTVTLPPARLAKRSRPASTPRLERLTTREVALVTDSAPFWAPSVGKPVRTSYADPRWVSLKRPDVSPNVRLLNAARVQGIASAARGRLLQRGWRRIEVGDHSAVRLRSVVLYPVDKRRIGMSLARHFGIESAPSQGKTVTVLLGRDVAARLHG